MGGYALRRPLHTVTTVLGVAPLTFLFFNAFGPDPVRAVLGSHAPAETIANLRRP